MKPMRLAIIGCGGIVAGRHAPAIKKCGSLLRLVALADVAAGSAEGLAAKHFPGKKPAIYTDYARMLEEVRPDAVIVATPHTLHFQHCYDALSAGAHVLVEKPMVTDSTDARKLLRRAKAGNRVLMIAMQGLYTDTFAYTRKLLSDGTIGPLQLVTGTLAQGWMSATRGTWRQRLKLSGGGQLYDSAAHVLSAMVFLVDSPVREVFCWADNKRTSVDINAVGVIRFANGCLGTITSGGNCPIFHSHVILQGSKALMEISPHGGNFRITGDGFKSDITKVPADWKIPTVSPVRNFTDVVLGRDKPRCTGELGVLLADLMDALYESVRTAKPFKITRRGPKR